MERRYISTTDTAKLIRKALRESFPGVKFSVRSKKYSGGASIDVSWTDGPTTKQVERVGGAFAGGYFDGMIDYKGTLYHELDGEPVHFCADFVFTSRSHTNAALCSAIIKTAMEYGTKALPCVEDFRQGLCLSTSPVDGYDGGPHWSWSNLIRRTLEETDDQAQPETPPAVTPQPSQTLESVTYQGSDGYGQTGGPAYNETENEKGVN